MKKVAEQPSISIIMPSLNVVDYIDECINSVIAQTQNNIEIICIDAGSTDRTWEVLESYANNAEYISKIRLIHSNIQSYGYQVNLGIHQANGEYIAILETDDYIENDMYDTLYQLAQLYDADYVKADYDSFFTLYSDYKEFKRVRLWPDNKDNYNKLINPQMDTYLYAYDNAIWKGIYKRDFLVSNSIYLNETLGAAYQDIGFGEMVHMHAKRAIYTNKSFYRYRTDRNQSSTSSLHGIQYAYQEFKRLLDANFWQKESLYLAGLYRHMTQSFLGEYIKTVRLVDYNLESEYIKPFCSWFKDEISRAISNGWLIEGEYSSSIKDILLDENKFCMSLKSRDDEISRHEEQFIGKLQEHNVVVFGVGEKGVLTHHLLNKKDIQIVAFCDNNESLWGCSKYHYSIYSPAECIRKYPNSMICIAVKYYKETIREQLLRLGVAEDRIVESIYCQTENY